VADPESELVLPLPPERGKVVPINPRDEAVLPSPTFRVGVCVSVVKVKIEFEVKLSCAERAPTFVDVLQ
jgi:hypothetical protein